METPTAPQPTDGRIETDELISWLKKKRHEMWQDGQDELLLRDTSRGCQRDAYYARRGHIAELERQIRELHGVE